MGQFFDDEIAGKVIRATTTYRPKGHVGQQECPHCGAKILKTSAYTYCPHCKKSLETKEQDRAVLCRSCHKTINASEFKCPYCGAMQ